VHSQTESSVTKEERGGGGRGGGTRAGCSEPRGSACLDSYWEGAPIPSLSSPISFTNLEARNVKGPLSLGEMQVKADGPATFLSLWFLQFILPFSDPARLSNQAL